MTNDSNGKAPRIVSLDQYRGYTVAGMLLVNFLGGYAAVPAILKHHHTYCSYADTIMPQFLFAVGFALRLTFLRRVERVGWSAAANALLRRCAGLVLLGFALYHLDGGVRSWSELQALGWSGFLTSAFRRSLFQTLVHIALTSIWVLPVITAGPWVRVGHATVSGLLHLALSFAFYYEFALRTPVIDGGSLGFLTWSIPLVAGTLAYDWVASGGASRATLIRMLGGSAFLMILGYAISCGPSGQLAPPPFVPPTEPVTIWTMSQRAGSLSYLTFSAGFSMAVYALFLVACDGPRPWRGLGLFRVFGRNALAAYVLHSLVAGAVKPYVPKDAPGWYVAAGFGLYFLICYLFVRNLEKEGVYIKL